MFQRWNNNIFPHGSQAGACRDSPIHPVGLHRFLRCSLLGELAESCAKGPSAGSGAGRARSGAGSDACSGAGSEGPRKALHCPPASQNRSAQQLVLSQPLHMSSHCSSKSSWQPEWRVFYPLSGNINTRIVSWLERFVLDVLLSKQEILPEKYPRGEHPTKSWASLHPSFADAQE